MPSLIKPYIVLHSLTDEAIVVAYSKQVGVASVRPHPPKLVQQALDMRMAVRTYMLCFVLIDSSNHFNMPYIKRALKSEPVCTAWPHLAFWALVWVAVLSWTSSRLFDKPLR